MSEPGLGGSWAGGWDEPGVLSLVIINAGTPGAGLFVYSGVPAFGNLIASITPAAGTDPFGNAYAPTIDSYGAGTNSAALNNGALILTGTPASNTSTIGENGVGGFAPGVRITTSSGMVYAPNGFGGDLTAANPVTNAPEAWHNMTLLNGWANVAGNAVASYRKVGAPLNCVQIRGVIIATAATAGTFFTLPAGYIPASANGYGAGANAGVPANQAPQIRWDTSGNLSVNSVGTGAANAVWISGLIMLDA